MPSGRPSPPRRRIERHPDTHRGAGFRAGPCATGISRLGADRAGVRQHAGDPSGIEPDPDPASVPRGLRPDGPDHGDHPGPEQLLGRGHHPRDHAEQARRRSVLSEHRVHDAGDAGHRAVDRLLHLRLSGSPVLRDPGTGLVPADRRPDDHHPRPADDARRKREPASSVGTPDTGRGAGRPVQRDRHDRAVGQSCARPGRW